MSIGSMVFEIRKSLRLNQTEFGATLGDFKQSGITNIETGSVKPDVVFLQAMHDVYNVNLNWLIADQK